MRPAIMPPGARKWRSHLIAHFVFHSLKRCWFIGGFWVGPLFSILFIMVNKHTPLLQNSQHIYKIYGVIKCVPQLCPPGHVNGVAT